MDWLRTLLPIAETGLKLYMSGKLVQKSAENAKEVAIRSSIFISGIAVFLVFFTAAIVMSFVDLGNQIEAQMGLHFSGMMWASMYLIFFGVLIVGACFLVTKWMEKKDQERKNSNSLPEKHPYASLILFGEEFLRNLNESLKAPRPPSSDPSEK